MDGFGEVGAAERDRLLAEMRRLAPWHLDVEVAPGLRTMEVRDHAPESDDEAIRPERVSFVAPEAPWKRLLGRIYPEGLGGRSFLDCACNSGGYSFWAREHGAERCFGFDVQEHWINQARFLAAERSGSEGLEFEVLNLYDLPARHPTDSGQFDLTLFQGIFYHLPDPITGLKAAADLTRDVLILDTATRTDLPDGTLAVSRERPGPVMGGVYGLNWFPTGPVVLQRILDWLGFPETRVSSWRSRSRGNDTRPESIASHDRPDLGRIRIIAARERGRLKGIRSVEEPS